MNGLQFRHQVGGEMRVFVMRLYVTDEARDCALGEMTDAIKAGVDAGKSELEAAFDLSNAPGVFDKFVRFVFDGNHDGVTWDAMQYVSVDGVPGLQPLSMLAAFYVNRVLYPILADEKDRARYAGSMN